MMFGGLQQWLTGVQDLWRKRSGNDRKNTHRTKASAKNAKAKARKLALKKTHRRMAKESRRKNRR